MALVAYDNSDSSDYEDDDNENVTFATIVKKTEEPVKSTVEETSIIPESNTESTPNLFNLLPQPSTKKPTVVEEDDEFLHKKEKVPDGVKPRAKIMVPSLSDFKDVESPTPAAKPRPSNGKKSGLLSMLPQPKNGFLTTTTKTTKSLIPHVLTQTTVKKKAPLPTPLKSKETKILNDSDDSDNDEVENDFFSMNKPVEVFENVAIPEIKTSEPLYTEPKRSRLESFFKKDEVIEVQPQPESYEEYSEAGSSNGNLEPESSGDIELDEEAILKLCGTRGKRKREDIEIIDINQQQVLADAKQWLMKGLMDDTTKRVSSSKRKGNEPTSQQKRKHQITYLAHQAKANEAELQNQWANSRMSRRQTQNKYGF